MSKNISNKDKQDWENFISKKEKLPNKDLNLSKKNIKIEEKIDLHGYTLEQANKVIEKFIRSCFLNKVSKILVVTGKGLHSNNEKDPYVSKNQSILKYSVPEFIFSNKDLMIMINELKTAKKEDGGSGAFYIYLKKNRFTK